MAKAYCSPHLETSSVPRLMNWSSQMSSWAEQGEWNGAPAVMPLAMTISRTLALRKKWSGDDQKKGAMYGSYQWQQRAMICWNFNRGIATWVIHARTGTCVSVEVITLASGVYIYSKNHERGTDTIRPQTRDHMYRRPLVEKEHYSSLVNSHTFSFSMCVFSVWWSEQPTSPLTWLCVKSTVCRGLPMPRELGFSYY